MNRKLAYIETIRDLTPIPGADRIEQATILGWKTVVRKGEFAVGEKIVFMEVDSWVPVAVAPFLAEKPPKVYNGVPGSRLRTMTLRGALSQGLCIKCPKDMLHLENGFDLTEPFDIQKWEAPVPTVLDGVQRPGTSDLVFSKKPDQERIQTCFDRIKDMVTTGKIVDEWIVQEKLEGAAMQVALVNGEIHVTSKNISLLLGQEGNTLVDVAKRDRLIELLSNITTENPVFIIQGELIGPGIQGNIYGLKRHEFRVFDIFSGNGFLPVSKIMEFKRLASSLGYELSMVPMQKVIIKGLFEAGMTVESILKMAEIKSALADTNAEGIVFKNVYNPNVSFKAISNAYLLNEKVD